MIVFSKKKIILSYQILELLNLWLAIKYYYNTIAKNNFYKSMEPKDFVFLHNDFKIIDIHTNKQVELYGSNNDLYQNLINYVKTKMQFIETIVNNQSSSCPIFDFEYSLVTNIFYTAIEVTANKKVATDLINYTPDLTKYSEV